MTVIGPEIFSRKQAERQAAKNVAYVQARRSFLRELWPPVTPEGKDFTAVSLLELQQIHLFNMFMLDICGASVNITLDVPPDEPLEIA